MYCFQLLLRTVANLSRTGFPTCTGMLSPENSRHSQIIPRPGFPLPSEMERTIIPTITGVLSITHGKYFKSDGLLLYKCHFLDGFRLRLRDLMEPNTLLPKSLSDRERWRGIRGGGDGEKEGEERGEREWQLPSRL